MFVKWTSPKVFRGRGSKNFSNSSSVEKKKKTSPKTPATDSEDHGDSPGGISTILFPPTPCTASPKSSMKSESRTIQRREENEIGDMVASASRKTQIPLLTPPTNQHEEYIVEANEQKGVDVEVLHAEIFILKREAKKMREELAKKKFEEARLNARVSELQDELSNAVSELHDQSAELGKIKKEIDGKNESLMEVISKLHEQAHVITQLKELQALEDEAALDQNLKMGYLKGWGGMSPHVIVALVILILVVSMSMTTHYVRQQYCSERDAPGFLHQLLMRGARFLY